MLKLSRTLVSLNKIVRLDYYVQSHIAYEFICNMETHICLFLDL